MKIARSRLPRTSFSAGNHQLRGVGLSGRTPEPQIDAGRSERQSVHDSALNSKADNPTCELIHYDQDPVRLQRCRFASKKVDAPQAILHVPDKGKP